MYAFAVWDEGRKRIFLARDPFGIKPLYYADDGRELRFASQVKALLAGGSVDTSPDPAGHVGFFLWGHVPEPFTLYKGIRALPAGTWMSVALDGQRENRRHFDVAAELAHPAAEYLPRNTDEAREYLRSVMRDSVRHHMVADVPVGIFLSSGRDSTTITALASEVANQGLRTFTLGFSEFRGTENDEVPMAEQVARLYGAMHETRWVDREDFAREISKIIDSMDQPSIDGVNTYFVAKCAQETGLKVALSGLGGDELFCGYPGFHQIPQLVRLSHPFKCVPGLGSTLRILTAPILKRITSPKYAGLLE